MNEKEILKKLKIVFPDLINTSYPFPSPYIGKGKIKAIVLGADPTHIIDERPRILNTVFELDNTKSPYWRSIAKNIKEIPNLSIDNLYVQNVCRNYFEYETNKNKEWVNIARDYWAPFLKAELDNKFGKEIPVLMTTEFILHSLLTNPTKKLKAKDIYSNKLIISPQVNILGRELIAFYRHYKYSLNNWKIYCKFISSKI